MTELWLATMNTHKEFEFKQLLQGFDVELHTAREIEAYTSPIEDGDSYSKNAMIKAKSLRLVLGNKNCWVIGEDSGIEVEGLGGLPGIHSARYAGDKALDVQNNDKLLKMLNLRSPGNRNAQYWCQIVALGPQDQVHDFGKACKGTILPTSRGKGGFGYDPLFQPLNHEVSMAELPSSKKNQISHRGLAVSELLERLEVKKA